MPSQGPVAQLVRAPPCHGGGREFESLLGRFPHQMMGEYNFISAAVAELADARDLKSSGWIVKLWRIFLEKSRNLKLHILQMCLHPSKTSLHFLRWFSWIRCTHICRCGGIGRRKGLKILRRVISVPVRVRPPALSKRD